MSVKMPGFRFSPDADLVKATFVLFCALLALTACSEATPYHSEQSVQLHTPALSTLENGSQDRPPATRTTEAQTSRLYVPAISSSDSERDADLKIQALTPIPTSGDPVPSLPFEICSPLFSIPLDELAEVVSAPYDPPPPGKDERHQGVDFAYYRRGGRQSILGDGVQAVLAGNIAGLVYDRYPYGNMLIVETPAIGLPHTLKEIFAMQAGESLYLLYAHMQTPPTLQMGEWVDTCQHLDTVGKSGNAGAAHLHLEARIGPASARFGSMAYYIESASEEERQTYRLWRTSGIYRHLDPMLLFGN